MPVSPFEFVSRSPSVSLARFVRSIWFARGTIGYRRERIAPTGSTVAVIVLGDPIRQTPGNGDGVAFTATDGLVAGPHDRPVINEPLGETHAVGVVTTPVGCEALFGQRPDTIRGRVVPLASFWPAGLDVRTELLEVGAHDALDHVESVLRSGLGAPADGWERCEIAVAMLESDPSMPIADIAAELDVSHNRLDREFTRVVGLSPRMLASLLRVRRLLDVIDVAEDIDWAGHAAEMGWYDQAHLIRDVRRYTGVSPGAYVRAQRGLLAADERADAAGFVPEP